MPSDRARLEAIKELALNFDPDDAVAMVADDIPWLIERLEEAIDLLHVESCSGLFDQSPLTTAFLSRFEDKP